MSTPKLVFRSLAGVLSAATFVFAAVLLYWGVSDTLPWSTVVPTLIGQCIFGIVFGLYALGMPGPFRRAIRFAGRRNTI